MTLVKDTKLKPFKEWLYEYNINSNGEFTAEKFLYASNIEMFLQNNLINNKPILYFFSNVDIWDDTKTYNKCDKVRILTKKTIDGVEYIQKQTIYISAIDNNTQVPNFTNRSAWTQLPNNILKKYIDDNSIINTIEQCKVHFPMLYGIFDSLCGLYSQDTAYSIIGLYALAYIFYQRQSLDSDGVGNDLIRSKSINGASYSKDVLDYMKNPGMRVFATPIGQIVYETIYPLIRTPMAIQV